MRIEQRYKEFIRYFSENMPEVKTELDYENDYQLLVAVVLSAQCTDKRVNATTPLLFKHFPDIKALSMASFESLSLIIKSISYPNNKSKNLISMAKILMETHKGLIPKSVEELVKLPGVGRKTANVLTSVLYNQPNMPVDTHVFRVSNRVGLTNNSKSPLETEKVLTKHIPKTIIPKAHHWLILHGRYVCKARRPNCSNCGIKHICNYYASLEAQG